MLGPVHTTAPIDWHSLVSNLNPDGFAVSFVPSAERGAFSPSTPSVSSVSCSRSPFQDITNDKFSHGQLVRSWSKGSDGPHSITTTAVPTRRSSLVLEPPPVQARAPRSPKSTTTRPRGRSDSQRKLRLSLLPLNGASRNPPRPVYPAGQFMSNLQRVGVEECRRWVTGTPPSTWPVLRATQSSTRAYTAITKHLPETLEQAIKDVECTLQCLATELSLLFLHNHHHLSVRAMDTLEDVMRLEDKMKDLERCIDRMEGLLSEVRSNSALQPIEDDGERDVHSWNRQLWHINRIDGSCTFSNGPALFVEAYVYRRLRGCFAQSTFWKNHDVFFDRKCGDFVRSADTVLELSQQFSEPFDAGDCFSVGAIGEDPRGILRASSFAYNPLVCIPEASNNHGILTESELQVASDKPPVKNSRSFPVNDGNQMWESLSKNYSNVGSRVDFVLNNAGLELFCDLALGDFMIQTGLASKVHFHGKQFPWSVSDATHKDWDWLIRSLSNKHLFLYSTSAEQTSLQQLGERWKRYEKEGKFVYEQHAFWCTGFSFWDLPTYAPDLFSRLSTSSLVLFKGNLNYRRLTAGCRVPQDTSFGAAIGPMTTHPRAPPVCSLRMFRDGRENDPREGYH